MPSASDEMRALWGGQDGVGEDKAESYLKAAGFTLTRGWLWEHPTKKTYESLTEEEYGAMLFLVQEWDYGGLVEPFASDSI